MAAVTPERGLLEKIAELTDKAMREPSSTNSVYQCMQVIAQIHWSARRMLDTDPKVFPDPNPGAIPERTFAAPMREGRPMPESYIHWRPGGADLRFEDRQRYKTVHFHRIRAYISVCEFVWLWWSEDFPRRVFQEGDPIPTEVESDS